ncbi:hypothetical protein [Streptomyces cinereoruber]|uniref:hypothetical protein n=1 Tax=Streptomyces cinereoruber TaxID=67260 RepID=UPI003641E560
MKQLVNPNLQIYEEAGLCLQFARRVFHAPAVEGTAWEGWQNTKYKHSDRNFPQDVAVPVWFDWTGDIGSGRRRYGHAAVRHSDGKIYSSPLTGYGRAWFNSVDDLAREFGGGMKYVGWSKDISGVKVVEEEDMAEKATLSTMRILTAGIWGHNGLAGRQNALSGSEDAHLDVGMELTNDNIEKLFYSGQAKQWRDSQDQDSLFGINKSLAELKQLRAEVEELRKRPVESSEAQKKLDDLGAALKSVLEIK